MGKKNKKRSEKPRKIVLDWTKLPPVKGIGGTSVPPEQIREAVRKVVAERKERERRQAAGEI